MQFVSILRDLWRHRLIVVMGLAFALPIGILMAYSVSVGFPPQFQSRQYDAGIGSAAVLVDSADSQIGDIGGKQTTADVVSLSQRARLIANLAATNPLKDEIAKHAGVRPDYLIASAPVEGPTVKATPLSTGSSLDENDPRAIVMKIRVAETLPIITAEVRAPTPAIAARVATSTAESITTYVNSVSTKDQVPAARKLVVERLGAAKSATVKRGPRALMGLAVFLLIFGLWCAGIVVAVRLARMWRRASEEMPAAPGTSSALATEPVPETGTGAAVVELPSAVSPAEATARPHSMEPPRAERRDPPRLVDRADVVERSDGGNGRASSARRV